MSATQLHLGAALAAAREQAGLSVDDVSSKTMIRAGLVRQIEAGDFDACGGDVYARGHLRNIARVVGVDATAWITEYDATYAEPEQRLLAAEVMEPDAIAKRELRERQGTNWYVPMATALGAISLIAAGSLIFSGGQQPAARDLAEPPTNPVVTTTAPAQPQVTKAPQLAYAGVVVSIRIVKQPSWVSVADSHGRVVFEKVLKVGETKEFRNTSALKVVLGNAGAVDLTVNGHHLGTPDALGKVFRTTFRPGDPDLAQG